MTTWVQFSSGRGPAECRLAVQGLSAVFGRVVGATLVDAEEDRDGHGWMSALMATDADEALVRPWLGTLEWVCPSPLRIGHKRKRWFVGTQVFLPPDPTDVRLRASDLRWEAMRASGPGGQHVNTTDSAVRLVHLPTNTVVTAREERSQHRNRSLALARLLAALEGEAKAVTAGMTRERRDAHDALERGNPVMSFEGPGFKPR